MRGLCFFCRSSIVLCLSVYTWWSVWLPSDYLSNILTCYSTHSCDPFLFSFFNNIFDKYHASLIPRNYNINEIRSRLVQRRGQMGEFFWRMLMDHCCWSRQGGHRTGAVDLKALFIFWGLRPFLFQWDHSAEDHAHPGGGSSQGPRPREPGHLREILFCVDNARQQPPGSTKRVVSAACIPEMAGIACGACIAWKDCWGMGATKTWWGS